MSHIPMASLDEAANIQTKGVSFDGTPPLINAVLGGHVMGGVAQPGDVRPHIESGTLRALFNVGSQPIPYLKDVPLLKDKGFNVVFDSNTSIFAPKGLPNDVLAILQDALKKTLEDPKVIEDIKKINLVPRYENGEEVQKQINAENYVLKEIVKKLNIGK